MSFLSNFNWTVWGTGTISCLITLFSRYTNEWIFSLFHGGTCDNPLILLPMTGLSLLHGEMFSSCDYLGIWMTILAAVTNQLKGGRKEAYILANYSKVDDPWRPGWHRWGLGGKRPHCPSPPTPESKEKWTKLRPSATPAVARFTHNDNGSPHLNLK